MKIYWIIGFVFASFFSCKNPEKAVKDDLLSVINKYIEFCEDRAAKSEITKETDIYWVVFYDKNESTYIEISQNQFYNKKFMQGYLKIGDNTVIFYHSIEPWVKTERLEKNQLRLPSENSDIAELGFTAVTWNYIIKDNVLRKVNAD